MVLGVCGPKRLPWIPDVPTVSSVIGQEYDMSTWHGVFAPKGTPAAILDTINQEVKTTMAKTSVQDLAIAQGFVSYPYKTRAEVAAFVREDKARWKRLVELAGVEPM